MSRNLLPDIIKNWKTKATEARSSLKRKQSSSNLEARLAVSPYAAILASPLRRCSFYGRIFPNKLLLRFGVAWHPESKLNWAFPTFKKVEGNGYYVHLQKEVLELLQRGAYRGIFRGIATYRSDMIEHVQRLLFQQPLTTLQQQSKEIYHLVRPTSTDLLWELDDSQKQMAPMGYHCILLFDPNNTRSFCELRHQLENQHNIPCYNMYKLWSAPVIKKLLADLHIPSDDSVALAIPKEPATIDLAISLWRCRQFIS